MIQQAVRRDLAAAGLRDNLAVFENFVRPIPPSPRGTIHRSTGLEHGGRPEQDPTNATKIAVDGLFLPESIPAFCFNGQIGTSESLGPASRLDHTRRYPWGELDVLDARIADTAMLYSSLLSKEFVSVSFQLSSLVPGETDAQHLIHPQALLERTKEELYEDYRTERLAVL